MVSLDSCLGWGWDTVLPLGEPTPEDFYVKGERNWGNPTRHRTHHSAPVWNPEYPANWWDSET